MRLYRTNLLIGAAAIAAIGFAGCGQKDDTPPSTTVVTTAPPPAEPSSTTVVPVTTPPGPTTVPPTNNTNAGAGGATGLNASLADAVNKKIRTNTQMTGSRITAVAEADGTIRLTGTAQNTQQKALAEAAAHDTTGVNHVINKVEIVATGGAKTAVAPAIKTITKTKVIVVKGPPSDSTGSTGGSADTSGSGSPASTGSTGTGSTDGTSTTGSANPTPPAPPTKGTGQ